MRNRTKLGVMFAAAIVVASSLHTADAQSGRQSVIARNRIRAQLAAAMADGHLDRSERRAILSDARYSFNVVEYAGLVQQLNHANQKPYMARTPVARRTASPNTTSPNTTSPNTTKSKASSPSNTNARSSSRPDRIYVTVNPSLRYASKVADPAYDDGAARGDSQDDAADAADDTTDGKSPFVPEEFADDYGCDDYGCGDCDYDSCGVEPEEVCNCEECCRLREPRFDLRNITLATSIDAFKGPMDLDGRNGNFGASVAINGGFGLLPRWGIGIQAGTNAIWSNFHGTQFTGASIREQNFTTVGLFQRITTSRGNDLKWGFAYDWMKDDYYHSFDMSQWRVKCAYEITPYREIGMWACIPDRDDDALLGGQVPTINNFSPVFQYNLYYRRCWSNNTSTTLYAGAIEEPGQFVVGSRVRVPIAGRASIIANFQYIDPSASGTGGQDEEMWNVAMGIEFTGRDGNRCRDYRYRPFLRLADNATFAIRRR